MNVITKHDSIISLESLFGIVLFKEKVASTVTRIIFHQGGFLDLGKGGLARLTVDKIQTSQVEMMYHQIIQTDKVRKSLLGKPIVPLSLRKKPLKKHSTRNKITSSNSILQKQRKQQQRPVSKSRKLTKKRNESISTSVLTLEKAMDDLIHSF